MRSQPDPAAFGHGAITQNGRAAAGGRKLLIVLGEYSNFSPYDAVHSLQYYELLGFGNPAAPFSTDDPVNPASLREYFRENSGGRFWFDRLGVIGPFPLGVYENDPGPEERSARILSRVAAMQPDLFVSTDTDGNHIVGFEELCVLLFENIDQLQPANRDNNPIAVTLDAGTCSR